MKPLSGLRVAEIFAPDTPVPVRLAGAFAGRMLADFGARVSFQPPAPGDALLRLHPVVDGHSACWDFVSAGKHAVAAAPGDLLKDQDALIVDEASHATLDTATSAGAAAILSLFPDDSQARPGSEFTVLATSGILDLIGDPEREPLQLAGHQAAYSAGLAAFTGLLAALCQKQAGTAGKEVVRINLIDTMLWVNWKSVIAGLDPAGAPTRPGKAAEWQTIRCADGWLALVYQSGDWPALRDLAGEPALHEPRFATHAARRAHGRELAAILEAGLSRHTRAEIRALAAARRLPLGGVWSVAELLKDPHYLARGVFAAAPGKGAMLSQPVVWNGQRLMPCGLPHA